MPLIQVTLVRQPDWPVKLILNLNDSSLVSDRQLAGVVASFDPVRRRRRRRRCCIKWWPTKHKSSFS